MTSGHKSGQDVENVRRYGPILTWGWQFLLTLLVFVWGKPLLMGRGEPPAPQRLASPVMGLKFEWLIYAISVLAVGIVWTLLQYQKVVGTLLGVATGIGAAALLVRSLSSLGIAR